jgi:hypothetical protein
MDLQQIIAQAGGIGAIAGQLGISESQASSGIGALLPAVLGGFKKSAQTAGGGEQGLGSLVALAESAGGGGLLANVLGTQQTDVNTGNGILGQIFGSKDVSRAVADNAAAQSGVDASILKKMLPIVSMLVAGYMAKSVAGGQGGGGLGDMLGSVLGGGGAQAGGGGLGGMLGSVLGGGAQAGGGLGGLLGSVLGGGAAAPAGGGGLGGIASMLDFDGDGNPLDDILGMAGKLTGR